LIKNTFNFGKLKTTKNVNRLLRELVFVNFKKKKMIVERQNNEIVVRFSARMKTSRIQTILDYLCYEELTSKSIATEDDVNELLKGVKKGRWNRTKEELGLDD